MQSVNLEEHDTADPFAVMVRIMENVLQKETYFGYKVHAMITLEGYITTFEITPASADDREGLRDLVEAKSGLVILGDKGYVGENFIKEMSDQGICLMALKRSNSKANWPKPVRQLIFQLRRRVETVFSQLSEQLHAERVLAKSFQGLYARLAKQNFGIQSLSHIKQYFS